METETSIEMMSRSIMYILTKDGEATARQLSDKLATNTTDVNTALAAMFAAKQVTREIVWMPSGRTYKYKPVEAPPPPLIDKGQLPKELARYVTFKGKRVARLTEAMFDSVQSHGKSGYGSLRLRGPNPATDAERNTARQQGMALPIGQHITLDVNVIKDPAGVEPSAYALEAPNQRTVEYLLLWHPQFKLGD